MVYRMHRPATIQSVDDVRGWAEDEFQALELDLSQTDGVNLRPLARAPIKPREGAVVYADGTNWDPGSGEGLYVYKNGAWDSILVQSVFQVSGTWTPALKFGGASTGLTYFSQSGIYVKIGRMVMAHLLFTVNAVGSSTGLATIEGLPFASQSAHGSGGIIQFYDNLVGTAGPLILDLPSGATTIKIRNSGATTVAQLNDTNFQSGSDIFAMMSYLTD